MKIKIKITPDSKRVLALDEMPAVKEIMRCFNTDADSSIGEFELGIAARIASNSNENFTYYDVQAEISKNCRAYNAYNDNSGDLDIWITFKAFNPYSGFYEVGIYLTDIWQSDGENSAEILSHMFVRKYKWVPEA